MIPSVYHSEEGKAQLDTHTKTFDGLHSIYLIY